MFDASEKAVEKLRERLVRRCSKTGIGFRIFARIGESGKATFSIKLDRQHQGDEVIESNGVKVFLDPSSAAQIRDYQLDYQDEPEGRFFLKTVQEAESG